MKFDDLIHVLGAESGSSFHPERLLGLLGAPGRGVPGPGACIALLDAVAQANETKEEE